MAEELYKEGYARGARDNNSWGWAASPGSPAWIKRDKAWQEYKS